MKKEMHPGSGQKTSEALDDSGPMTLVPNTREWSLCSESEKRWREAVEKRAFILVNNKVLLKIRGKLTGLVLEKMEIEGGVLEPGIWYVPDGKNTRNEIRQAFDMGKKRKMFTGVTHWVKMREVDKEKIPPEELDALTRRAMKELGKSSLWTIDPRGYRMRNQELDEVEYGEDTILDFID